MTEKENKNKLFQIIKEQYGSIENLSKQTQDEGLSRTYLYNLCNSAQSNPTLKTLQILAKYLNLTIEEVSKCLLP